MRWPKQYQVCEICGKVLSATPEQILNKAARLCQSCHNVFGKLYKQMKGASRGRKVN